MTVGRTTGPRFVVDPRGPATGEVSILDRSEILCAAPIATTVAFEDRTEVSALVSLMNEREFEFRAYMSNAQDEFVSALRQEIQTKKDNQS